jgi:hypothetical protein
MKPLHRAAGRFTVLKGTDRILHFVEAIPNAIHASTDMYEVVLFRALRRSVRAGHVTSINPDGSSFYLLMASMLHRMANRADRPISRIRHLNAKLGAEFEGLKLLAETRTAKPLWFDALFPSRVIAQDFDVLHRRIDRFESSVRLGETRISKAYMAFRPEPHSETIDVIDWFKEPPVPIRDFLAERFADGSQTQRLFAVIRCGWDERIDVQDLFSESHTLPSMPDIRAACADLGLFGSVLFMHDFDRDFLLPFEGTYGLALLYVTRQAEDLFTEAGFRDVADDAIGEQRAVVTTDQFEQPRSYDALFSAELPELDEPTKRDWARWKAERDWDPGAFDWKVGSFRGDAMLIPVAVHAKSEQTTNLALSLLGSDADDPLLSTEGMLHAATAIRASSPVECFYAVFVALDRAREAPRLVGYILEALRYRAGGGFSEIAIRDLEDGAAMSFAEASRLLCVTLLDMGWLDDRLSQQHAREAIQHALKDNAARLEAALASLSAVVVSPA